MTDLLSTFGLGNAKGKATLSYKGRVSKIYFADEATDFYIFLSEDLNKKGKTKVKGNFFSPRISTGVDFEVLEFEWETSPKYGSTLVAKKVRPLLNTRASQESCLVSACVSLSAAEAQGLVKHIRTQSSDFLSVMDSDAYPFSGVSFLPQSRCKQIWQEWKAHRAYVQTAYELTALGLPPQKVKAIYEELGSDAWKKVQSNPYSLALVEGISFPVADRIAIKWGFSADSQERIASILEFLLEKASVTQGHLYLTKRQLLRSLNALPQREKVPGYGRNLDLNDLEISIQNRESKGRVVVEGEHVYLKDLHDLEIECVDMLLELSGDSDLQLDTQDFLKEYERIYGISFSAQQQEAVKSLNENKVLLLTGLPGTGKSTCTKALVRMFHKANLSVTLMAPTGIAAKRLSKVVGEDAGTIHRTLGFSPDGTWEFGSENKFSTDAVVVDEASMVDQKLFHRLLSALSPRTILVLVGDDAQLPSVGAGNVLHDLIDSQRIKRVHLTEIFRQSSASDIVLNAHNINAGRDLVLGDPRSKDVDFRFVEISEPREILQAIKKVTKSLFALKDKTGATFQILSPTYKGEIGVDVLNREIKAMLNPLTTQQEISLSKRTYREEDRLMVVKNHYSLDVFNGEVGKLYRVDKKKKEAQIKIFDEGKDRLINVPFVDMASLTKLAYAVTIHKSQGQEFDYVILPFHEMFSVQLQRNLLYTAITRAKKKVFVFGQYNALRKAIRNDSVSKRQTNFSRRLQEAFS